MKVNDLSKELNVTNKDLISYLKENDFKISSHNQNVTDEMIDLARDYFSKVQEVPEEEIDDTTNVKVEPKTKVKKQEAYVPKTFAPDDRIACRSVTPWKLVEIGADRTTIYNWSGYGDVDYVTFKDLQSMRRKDIIKNTKIVIEDADLCYQWRRELGDTYKYFLSVEFPEEFFDLSDDKFKKLLIDAPDVVKEVIKFTAMNMVRNENYPTVQKLTIIDEILGTCIKDFL